MQSTAIPAGIQLPFANAGAKQTIPVASQIGVTPGRASYTDGFPPLTRTAVIAGGVPPFGTDMNGILYAATAIQQWQTAGGAFKFDNTWSTANGGYPKGAVLCNANNDGFWQSLIENNTTDPDAAANVNWLPVSQGSGSIALTNVNVTLTPAQYSKPTIVLTGTLTGNVQLTFPKIVTTWRIVNRTSGAFTVSAVTAAGIPVAISQGASAWIRGDGTNVLVDPIQSGGLIGVQVFDASATYTPTAGMATVIVEVQASGGAGGGTPVTGAGIFGIGSGGASGSYALARLTAAQVGASVAVTIGAAGAPVSAGNGGNGGAVSFGALISCPGGPGGVVSTPVSAPYFQVPANPGALPTGTGLILATSGISGLTGQVVTGNAMSGGGGGSPMFRGGGGGPWTPVVSQGLPGTARGAGGGGCAQGGSGAALQGGAGVAGRVIAWEFA